MRKIIFGLVLVCIILCLLVGCKDSSNTKKLLFIDVTLSPTDYVFSVGDNVKDHLIVKGYYSDGTVETITDYSTDIETVTSDTKSVTVTYGSKTKTIPISVSGSLGTLMSIEVLKLPTKINYTEKSLFDDSGLVVVGVYSDGSKRVITDYTLSLKNGESVGTVDSGDKKTIINTATYNGDSSITTSFEITIKKLSSYTLIKQTDWCSSVEKSTITKIIFDYTDNLPSNLKDKLHIHIGNSKDDIIYLIEDETVLYIFSDGIICGNNDCRDMFNGFLNLKEITFRNFDTSKVTNMNSMFINCLYLETLDLNNWNTSNVTDMEGMFSNCLSLKTLKIGWDKFNVTNMNSMFLNVGKKGTTITINPNYKEKFDTVLSDWKYTSTTDLGIYQFIYTMKKGNEWLPSSVNKGNITKIVFDYTNLLPQNIKNKINTQIPIGNNTETDLIYLIEDGTELYIFSDELIYGNSDCYLMFYDFISLTDISFNNFDTSKVTDMNGMFSNCKIMTSLNLSNFDTSKVTDMKGMFNNCKGLSSLDLSMFDTSKVTNMYGMFSGCTNLTSLDLSNFKTSNVNNMWGMFNQCSELTSITFGKGFNTSNVTNMSYMFNSCTNLTSLDLSSFNITSTTDRPSVTTSDMFDYVPTDIPIYVSNVSDWTSIGGWNFLPKP